MPKSPLDGIIVIDFSTIIAAPLIGTLMADFGAEVIKVELPKVGDVTRGSGGLSGKRSPFWLTIGRNKKSVTLDLHTNEGQEIARKLCSKADVALFNYRPGVIENWNLGPEVLHKINPDLIIGLVSGYGQTGPYKDKGGFDRTVSAFTGVTYTSGYPENPPVRSGFPLIDYLTGYLGAFAVMMALYNRDVNKNGGEIIDLSLTESAFRTSGGAISMYSKFGSIYERAGNRIRFVVPAENFETQDGRIVAINANSIKLWERLAGAMKRKDLLTDNRFNSYLNRIQNQDELYEIIGDWVKDYTTIQIMQLLEKAEVPCEKVNSIADLAEDPHMRQREAIIEYDDYEYGKILVPGIVPKLKNFPGQIKFLGAKLGEYNQEVFQDLLGLSPDEIKKLGEKEVI
ncbi:MAG: Succinyl-CoA:(R)-benzylsuccinate CoA-transferase subunit BbsF [Candidatus Lokiarchaeum sp. GC14_75]|nr:MAG: Succinyl-CoA:(R)-benzylsuccinate CoA-transferase subunit BbsF [Candidatus Lokiarchaeum sp. GC14_75]